MGNEPPDLSSAPGVRRGRSVLFEYGTLETTFRIAVTGSGFAFQTRDRGSSWALAEFSRLDDAERFVLLWEGARRSSASWFDGLTTVPDGVVVLEDRPGKVLRWDNGGEDHVARALSDASSTLVGHLAWVRTRSLPEVLALVDSVDPGRRHAFPRR
ncbi:hypothetical protein L2091_07865 [Curtobacterium albidum]|uniref:hypothetical protein n=1 Tax=Curtobacterium citreum TaxID=2036 RepID=UPI0020269956|nr:hypothetical protein [Curtobacterium albidum]MCL9665144.1 hypothetical protein [Curtobacterium albidum]